MNSYPSGSVIICRFAFTYQPLTAAQLATFLAGNGLPSGQGVAPSAVLFDITPPDQETQTLTGGQIVVDGTGAYHAAVPVINHGIWSYRGYGQDGIGNPVVATPTNSFRVTRS